MPKAATPTSQPAPDALRLAFAQLQRENVRLHAENAELKAQNAEFHAQRAWLVEQMRRANQRLYAPSSERAPAGQGALLFNEAEALADPKALEPEIETIQYPRKKRKVAGQRALDLADFPVVETVHELSEEQRVCPDCRGSLHEMGEDIQTKIDIVPASVRVLRRIRKKYACRHCQLHALHTPVVAAPVPETAFPNSLASSGAVAHILCQKYAEGMPLYRQEAALKRLGCHLPRQTLANWMLVGAGWLDTLLARLVHHLKRRDIACADETEMQVLKEPGRAAETKSFMWLYRSGRDGPEIAVFDYQPTRAAQHPKAFLAGYQGYLQVDGYVGYEALPGVTLVGCWAHARRKFVEALKTLPKETREKGGTPVHAGLAFCDALFRIERSLQEATPEERLAARKERSAAVLAKCKAWLDAMAGQVLPKSLLGAAVTYCRNQWEKLTAFLLDGRLEIDNNRSERTIKPFVIGRKNWLFANTPKGARASATIYSVVETAKANGLNPLPYLTYLFETLPNIDCRSDKAIDALLPWSPDIQERFRIPERKLMPN